MKVILSSCLSLVCGFLAVVEQPPPQPTAPPVRDGGPAVDDRARAEPYLLRITATVDGSGKMTFTSQAVCYEHKHWSLPTNVVIDDKP